MKRQAFGRDRGLTSACSPRAACSGCSTSSSASSCSRPERRDRADDRDRRRPRVLPVLHLRQARAAGLGREDRRAARRRPSCTTWSSGSARWPTCRSRGSRMIDTRRAERVRDRPHPEARRGRGHDRALAPARAARGRGRARARALAHRQPRRADHDARRASSPCSPALLARFGLYCGMFGGGRRDNNGPPVWLIVLARLGRHLRAQLHPDPDDLALPRVRRRPRRGAHHRRARAPDERAAEDLVADDADPAARPPRGRGDERVLHHPDELEVGVRPSCSRPTRRSRSASRRSPRSRARWAAPSQ